MLACFSVQRNPNSVSKNAKIVTNIRAPAAEIDRNIPVIGVRNNNLRRKVLIMSAVILKSAAAPVRGKIAIGGNHEIALSIAIQLHDVATVQILA